MKITKIVLNKKRNIYLDNEFFKKNFNYSQRLRYTIEHRKAFKKVEKELLGKNTTRGHLHDVNKLVFYIMGIPTCVAHKMHQLISKHHVKNGKVKDPIAAIIDWECARHTKPDKQHNAYEFYKNTYPEGIPNVEETMKKLGLWQG